MPVPNNSGPSPISVKARASISRGLLFIDCREFISSIMIDH